MLDKFFRALGLPGILKMCKNFILDKNSKNVCGEIERSHKQKRLQERSRIPAISGERTCTSAVVVVIFDVNSDSVDEATAVAEQCHPEVLAELRRHLIEQLRAADIPFNDDPLLAAVSRY